MPDQQTNSGTPGGAASSGSPTGNAPAQPEINPRSRGHSPAMDARRQQPAPGEQPADAAGEHGQPSAEQPRGGENGYPQEVNDALARDAEARIRQNTLPKTETEYAARNSETFKLPEGVSFQFNEADPELADARKIALKHGLSQEAFSDLLDLHVKYQIGNQTNVAIAKQKNLDELGAAGPQRIDAIATWLGARAGDKDGMAVANFLKQYPAAPMIRTFERLIRQFASQGGANYSGQHRETADAEAGKIPGYENMSFAQKRAYQMAQMLSRPGYRGGGNRRGE